ncbi:hypothetical protein [Kribbella sp. NPDC048928]|uniref:hypothetical protein n=1 Tax=Kribbella sp. NPDC048928 TaxID=3364111 RepID=UPI0037188797
MPTESVLRRGAHRDFVDELFWYYRSAGRPTLRVVAEWIAGNEQLAGTASPETVRRVLVGKVQPSWPTAEAILHALCALADLNVDADRWPDDNFHNERTVTRKSHLQALWNLMLDEEPAAAVPMRDPWAAAEEPPF